MAYGTVNADVIQSSVSGVSLGAGNATNFKNRIINGSMAVSQYNSTSSVTPADGAFVVDRFRYNSSQASKFTAGQNLNSATTPAGFINYLGFQTASAVSVGASDYFFVQQNIEGLNVSDLGWGTANAKTVTLSFWVYSSLTGTFGGAIRNPNGYAYSYPFSYTVSSANTWTQVSITITGPTSTTWLTNNSAGVNLTFSLGMGSTYSGGGGAWTANNYLAPSGSVSVVGTNGATWYVTGVQLEVGSSATGFEYRDYARELFLCQRYFTYINGASGNWSSGSSATFFVPLSCPLRTTPSLAYSGTINGQAQGVNTWTSTTQPASVNVFAAASGTGFPNNKLDFSISGFSGAWNLNTTCILFGQTITVSAEL